MITALMFGVAAWVVLLLLRGAWRNYRRSPLSLWQIATSGRMRGLYLWSAATLLFLVISETAKFVHEPGARLIMPLCFLFAVLSSVAVIIHVADLAEPPAPGIVDLIKRLRQDGRSWESIVRQAVLQDFIERG